MMPTLELLIKFVLLLIIFQVSFSVILLVANWRLSPEFWSPKLFSTRHGDQNGHSLERCYALNNKFLGLHVIGKFFKIF